MSVNKAGEAVQRMLLRIKLLGGARWSAQVDQLREARAKSGYTSVRVSRATRTELDGLLRRVQKTHPEWKDRGAWKRRHLSLDELLYAIARADVKACAAEVPATHARRSRGKQAAPDVGETPPASARELEQRGQLRLPVSA